MEMKKEKIMLWVVLMLFVFGGCQAKTDMTANTDLQTETEQTTNLEQAEEVKSEVVEEVSNVEKEEEKLEIETISEPEVKTYETVDDWVKTVDKTEPKLTIWNSISKQGIILENEQNYVVKEGDQIVLCYIKNERIGFPNESPMLKIGSKSFDYFAFEFIEEPMEPTLLEINPRIDGVDYALSVNVVSEKVGEIAFEIEKEKKEASGKNWANTLSFDEPKLLIWNDETGTREIIDENGEYALEEGDTVAAYTPENYEFDYAGSLDYYTFIGAVNEGKVSEVLYMLPEESTECILMHYLIDKDGNEREVKYTIITP